MRGVENRDDGDHEEDKVDLTSENESLAASRRLKTKITPVIAIECTAMFARLTAISTMS